MRPNPPDCLLLALGFGVRFHLCQLAIQLLHCQLKRGDFVSGSHKVAIDGGDLVLCFASQFDQRLLKKLDIGLQASGTTFHPWLGRATFHPANVLCGYRRQHCDEQCHRKTQKMRCAEPKLPKLRLFAFHA